MLIWNQKEAQGIYVAVQQEFLWRPILEQGHSAFFVFGKNACI